MLSHPSSRSPGRPLICCEAGDRLCASNLSATDVCSALCARAVGTMITDLDIYRFDLRGYLEIPRALTAEEVAELNACLDAIPSLEPGDWYGYIHAHRYGANDGL